MTLLSLLQFTSECSDLLRFDGAFISPPNVYMTNTGLVPGSTGGYTARWCQRAVSNLV